MMDDTHPTWPRRFPVYRFGGLVLASVCGVLLIRAWIQFAPPLQRFYLRTYARQTVLGSLPRLGTKATIKPIAVAFAGTEPATDGLLATNHGPLSVKLFNLDPVNFQAWLKLRIYDGKSLGELLRWPLGGFGMCVLLFSAFGAVLDRVRNTEARNGRLLRGPSLTSRWMFNHQTRGNRVAFPVDNKRHLFECLSKSPALRIRRDREAHHIQIAGDTGSGKSTLVRNILYEVEARGETAIIFDPDREYIREFLDPERGDWVLNPKDDRCPYWPIGVECDDEPTATPIANGLFPDEPSTQKFFLDHTRAIFAYLLASCRPTVSELAYWMAHPEEIDKRVKGTEHEHTLTVNAAPQRAGILGSLNHAGKPLRMMPVHDAGRRTWTVREWARQRRGCSSARRRNAAVIA